MGIHKRFVPTRGQQSSSSIKASYDVLSTVVCAGICWFSIYEEEGVPSEDS